MSSVGRALSVFVAALLLGSTPGAGGIDVPATAADAGGVTPTHAPQAVPTLTDSARVSLVSILPGDRVYSVFGHSALRVRDPVLGIDRAYNFGTFDFGETPLDLAAFVARFTYGDLNYRLSVQDPGRMVRGYWQVYERPSVEQVLDLTGVEAGELFRRLEINALPENRYYRYDFFFDNCATRLLDVMEAVLGDRLSFPTAEAPGRSFRELLDPYLAGARWVDLGMDLGLGRPADRHASAREATFLPEQLMDYVAAGRIDRGAGGARPLVRATRVLTGPPAADWRPDSDPPWPLITMGGLLFAGLLATVREARRSPERSPGEVGEPPGGRIDAVFFGGLGVAGLAVVFLWFVSLHRVTDLNFNLAWALPTHLVLAAALWRRAAGRRSGLYLAVTAGLAGLLLVGMPAGLWPQELPVALAPLLLLITVRAGWLGWVRLNPPASPPSPP